MPVHRWRRIDRCINEGSRRHRQTYKVELTARQRGIGNMLRGRGRWKRQTEDISWFVDKLRYALDEDTKLTRVTKYINDWRRKTQTERGKDRYKGAHIKNRGQEVDGERYGEQSRMGTECRGEKVTQKGLWAIKTKSKIYFIYIYNYYLEREGIEGRGRSRKNKRQRR